MAVFMLSAFGNKGWRGAVRSSLSKTREDQNPTTREQPAARMLHPTWDESEAAESGADMSTPQQPELRRSGRGSTDQDAAKLRADESPQDSEEELGPVPEDNRPGHRPAKDQDKPDPDERP
jgi:hypothetical protein